MSAIRVETSAAVILLAETPDLQVRDRQAGGIAKGVNGGEAQAQPPPWWGLLALGLPAETA